MSTATISTHAGEFGALLGTLGFGEGVRHEHWLDGTYWTFDAPGIRVACWPDDGDRTEVYGVDPVGATSWQARFSGNTPFAVVEAMLRGAIQSEEDPA